MTPEDRAHLDGRFDKQDTKLDLLLERSSNHEARIKAIEDRGAESRSGSVALWGIAIGGFVAAIGTWIGEHFGGGKT